MKLIETQNNYEFIILIDENIVYLNSDPDLKDCNIIFKSFDNVFNYYNVNLSPSYITWFKKDDNDFFIIEIIKNGLLFKKTIIREMEKPLIDKCDITIIADDSLNIETVKYFYDKYGNVIVGKYGDNYDTKYVIYLKKYLINMARLINEMFFNSGKTLKDINNDVYMIERNSTEVILVNDLKIKNIDI